MESVTELAGGPIQVHVGEAAKQRRVTVLFRSILAIPQTFIIGVLGFVAEIVVFLGWFGALFTGRLPQWAIDFVTGFLRWEVRVGAYMLLLTDKYPPFSFDEDAGYPVRLAVAPPAKLNRLAVLFRIVLAIPAMILNFLVSFGSGVAGLVIWLIALVAGRMPPSLQLALTAVLRYQVRYSGWLFMLTPTYPGGLFGDVEAGATPTGPVAEAAPAPAAGADTASAEIAVSTPPAPWMEGAAPAPAAPSGDFWVLRLTAAAKRLVVVFLVLGVLALGAGIAIVVLVVAASGSTTVDAVVASGELQVAVDQLSTAQQTFQQTTQSCSSVSCQESANESYASALSQFTDSLSGISFPSGDVGAAQKVVDTANQEVSDLHTLDQTSTAQEFESSPALAAFQSDFQTFQQQASALLEMVRSQA